MKSSSLFRRLVLSLSLTCVAPAHAANLAASAEAQTFVAEMAEAHQFDASDLTHLLAQRAANARVLKLIAPPASKTQRSWERYRPRFLDEFRIRKGLEFWQQHAATLTKASQVYGVPEEIIVAIIGVETVYGLNTGDFDTLEALATLAFHYPPRATFFRQELEQFLLLARENRLSPASYRGSFAGALGVPQFMPGSQRRYAVDFDGDGRIDLAHSVADAIGSVAHFLNQHGWQAGSPIAVPADLARVAPEQVETWIARGIQPMLTVRDLRATGVASAAKEDETVTLIDLVTPGKATEYWLGYGNFYVITRYNRSSFYAMSVFQLAETLRSSKRAAALPRVQDKKHRSG
ncbi:MAG: lytic murein transglycosylase B [Zoogloeaceae bacterium]|jgi:membrane-bound lytic murein transglycosylase B|nr:lytic murein transglycosylase B [Zoogloeaceae bacterium]